MMYEHFSWKADCTATSNRADAVLLVRLRSGHTPLLKAYAHLLDPAADPTCPLCKKENIGRRDAQVSMSSGNTHLVVLRPHSGSSRPTPRRHWRSLSPLSRALGARLNNNSHRSKNTGYADTPGSVPQSKTFLEVLFVRPSRSLVPTIKRYCRSLGSPSSRPFCPAILPVP